MTTKDHKMMDFIQKYAMSVKVEHEPVEFTHNGQTYHVAQQTFKIDMPLESFNKLMNLDNQQEAERKIINSNLTVKAAYDQYQILLKLCADYN